MGSSALVGVKKALRDLLETSPRLDDVQVSYAYPGDDTIERECVFFGDALFDHEPAGMRAGRTPRNESAEFELVVQVIGKGQDAEWCEERAIEIGKVVEETVADNRVFGGDVANGISVYAVTIRGGTMRTRAVEQGNATQLTYKVRPDSRLT